MQNIRGKPYPSTAISRFEFSDRFFYYLWSVGASLNVVQHKSATQQAMPFVQKPASSSFPKVTADKKKNFNQAFSAGAAAGLKQQGLRLVRRFALIFPAYCTLL